MIDIKNKCSGCDGHKYGPHRFGCHSEYANKWRLMWVARHGQFGGAELRGTNMTPSEFEATMPQRFSLIRERGLSWYASFTNDQADELVRKHAVDDDLFHVKHGDLLATEDGATIVFENIDPDAPDLCIVRGLASKWDGGIQRVHVSWVLGLPRKLD